MEGCWAVANIILAIAWARLPTIITMVSDNENTLVIIGTPTRRPVTIKFSEQKDFHQDEKYNKRQLTGNKRLSKFILTVFRGGLIGRHVSNQSKLKQI